ncbi:conserved hypothetical protein [Microscilla marina ATCC 23134]|uniref:MnmC-like methyltransferase domain-containing protein n=2 Tax=Microscilla marina TaxID=1027 RepID=A1ZYD2_MICM2|nr:conserved hypothetical protein [Microscilla marina ATCC 23134]
MGNAQWLILFSFTPKIEFVMNIEIIETEDGSHTLFSKTFNEIYHSRRGAIEESHHVFIDAGLKYLLEHKTELTILEVGFGTGLNALLTALEVHRTSHKINYFGVEPFPVPSAVVEQLNYPQLIDQPSAADLYKGLHECPWNEWQAVESSFQLYKAPATIEALFTQHALENIPTFDLVYFDAFAPSKHPEIWTLEVLQGIRQHLASGAILVTYCAKGQFKRDLKAAGFELESLPGPHFKREMTRGKAV